MGYNVHITGQKYWTDQNPELKISEREWLEYVETDPELKRDGAEVLWLKHPEAANTGIRWRFTGGMPGVAGCTVVEEIY